MATKIVVAGSNVSAPQLSDLFRQIGDGSLNGIHLQAFLDHRNPFGLENVVIDWKKVYELLDVKVNINNGDVNDSNYWVVPVFKGATPNKVVKALRDIGVDVYLYKDDLDKDVPTNDRDPVKDGDYRVKFLKTIEADPGLAEKSADMLAEEKIKGITLLERLLLELGYFLATGNHLDIENVTLCSGSRCSDGSVPHVSWSTDYRKVCVDWDNSSDSGPLLRARAVVS
ncbi:MAG: hypothetical protein KBC33_00315 [Candidatus Pacebacteria bacterium]|nr:hypothetical protein [Candidatus Paceibacterota bacterium]